MASNQCLSFTVLLGIDPFKCSSYAVYPKAQACCMSDVASHHFSSVRCTNLFYFEKKKRTMALTNVQKVGNSHRVGLGYRYRRVAVTLQRELVINIVQDKMDRR